MGCLLIWDLLRLINPTHVIHLTARTLSLDSTNDPNVWFSRDLVPINDFTYNNSLGWLLPPCSPHQHCPVDPTPVVDTLGHASRFSFGQCSSKFPSDDEGDEAPHTDTTTVTLKKHIMVIKKWKQKARRKLVKRLQDRKKSNPARLTGHGSNKRTFIRRKYQRHHIVSQSRQLRRAHTNEQHTALDTYWHDCGPFQLLTLSTTSHLVHR